MDMRYRIAPLSVHHSLCLYISLLSVYYLGLTETRLSPSHYLGLTTTRLSTSYGVMDRLSQIAGLHTNLPRREFVDILSLQPVSSLKLIRTSLLTEAQACQNTIPDGLQGLPLVSRRDSVLRPIASILSDDIWCISQAIENDTSIPRTMFKNGKRSKQYLATVPRTTQEQCSPMIHSESVASNSELSPSRHTCSDSHDSIRLSCTGQPSLPTAARFSEGVLIRELNSVKQELRDLRTNIASLNRRTSSDIPGEFQMEFCRELKSLKQEVSHLRESMYESSGADQIPTQSSQFASESNRSSIVDSISITTWNCRGLSNAVPYIDHLMESGSDVIAIYN